MLLARVPVAEPLIDLRFFASVPFSGATLIAVAAFASLGGFLFLPRSTCSTCVGSRRCTPGC